MALASGETAQVEVRFASLPPQEEWLASCGADVVQIEVKDVGRFRVGGGREIVIDPVPGVSERNLRIFLLGSAMGALLHQRGLLALHANAVVIDGCAIAFIGRSGAGKSTLAAWFQDRGHPMLADDVCAVRDPQSAAPVVVPGVPRLRLWKDALDRTGRSSSDFDRSFDGFDKFDVPASESGRTAPAALAACYWLDEPDGPTPLQIERVTGAKAVEILIANTYRGAIVPLLGKTAPHLRSCLNLARLVPMHRIARHKDHAQFDAVAAELESHVRELLGEKSIAAAG
jgi:hypothetical protein